MNLWSRFLFGMLMLLIAAVRPALGGQGLIYGIYSDDGPRGYLVGTMHSEDPRVVSLLGQLVPLIEQVDVVAIEMVPDAVALIAVGAATLLPPDRDLRGLIGEERFESLVAAAAPLGLPRDMLDRLKPWAAAMALGMPRPESGRFLDMEIYLQALQLQRPVVGLETAAEQLAVFEHMDPGLQLVLLDAMVKNAPHMPKQLEELTQAYLLGDLEQMDQVARSQTEDMPPKLSHWFDELLLDRRNARMLDRLSPLLGDGTALIAVGAMHLSGDTGLVAVLRKGGYRVEPWRE